MGSTNKTKNYNLPQFVATDKPTWLGDVNGANLIIDTALDDIEKKADEAVGNSGSSLTLATDAKNMAQSATNNVASLTTRLESAETGVANAQGTANSAQNNASTAQTTANNAQTRADSAMTLAGQASTELQDIKDILFQNNWTPWTQVININSKLQSSASKPFSISYNPFMHMFIVSGQLFAKSGAGQDVTINDKEVLFRLPANVIYPAIERSVTVFALMSTNTSIGTTTNYLCAVKVRPTGDVALDGTWTFREMASEFPILTQGW